MSRKVLVMITVLCFLAGVASARKMAILSFSKGELADSNYLGEVALEDKYGEKDGDFTMKCDFQEKEKGSAIGVYQPKKAAWSGFTKVRIVMYNPNDKDVKVGWMIKGAKGTNGPDNRKDWELALKPGRSEHEISIVDVKCNDGASVLDVSKIFIWAFWGLEEKPYTVYVVKLGLENDEK
jgi:hypothetical protein